MSNTIYLRIERIVNELFNGNKSEFARNIGVSESGVRSYLTGTIPNANVLEKIASNLGISCEWLVLGQGDIFAHSIGIEGALDDLPIEDKLLAIIKEKDDKIEQLARSVGRLEGELSVLKKMIISNNEQKDAGDVECVDVAR